MARPSRMRSSFSFPLISIAAPWGCALGITGVRSPESSGELNTLDIAEPTDNAEDSRFMRLALALGSRGLGQTWPNPAVGAVVVKDGVIIGRGWTQPGGRPHAETQAIKRAGEAAQGATIYVSLEPCAHRGRTPPCADAIIKAGVARVV